MKVILEVVFAISFIVVSVFYVIIIYEKLVSEEKFSATSLIISYVKEIFSLFFILLFWILGFTVLESFLPRRKSEVVSVPIFLIPGFMLTKSSMYLIFLLLRNRGFENIFILNPLPLFGKIEEIADNISNSIKEICEVLGKNEIVLLGHSIGGVVARYITHKEDELGLKVKKCITLGTPHTGTKLAYILSFLQAIKQVRPSSPMIKLLGEQTDRIVSIIGEFDEFVFPVGDNQVILKNSGHFSILFSSEVVEVVYKSLALPKPEEKPVLTEGN